jgi:hypothetical protein
MLCVATPRGEWRAIPDSNIPKSKDLRRLKTRPELLAQGFIEIARGKYSTFGKIDRWANLGGLHPSLSIPALSKLNC